MILITILAISGLALHFIMDYFQITRTGTDPDKTKDIIYISILSFAVALISSHHVNIDNRLFFIVSHGLLSSAWHFLLFDTLIAVYALKKSFVHMGSGWWDTQFKRLFFLKKDVNLYIIFWLVKVPFFIGAGWFYWWVNF